MIEPPFPHEYQVFDQCEQDALCAEILAEVAAGKFKPAGEPSRQHWEKMWAQNRTEMPYFLRPAAVLRVNGQFVRPKDEWLELKWYERFRDQLLKKYFKAVPAIYEFGCGNGWNLMAARHIFPDKTLVGLDWAESAVSSLPWYIRGYLFDFFRPDYSLKLDPGFGVWTVGALEQTGQNWMPFLAYLLEQKPAICVHVEPILEWYDQNNPVDRTAIEYHLARNYWTGFPSWMSHLEELGKVKIIETKRSLFGSKYIEGYSLFVWRPT